MKQKKEKKEKTKKVLLFWGSYPTRWELSHYKRKYKGKFSRIEIYEKSGEWKRIELVPEEDLWYYDIKIKCNQEGLLHENCFDMIPSHIREKATWNEYERSGSCYVSDDGVWYNPDTNEFTIVRTINNQ